jgi:hypothetical protein
MNFRCPSTHTFPAVSAALPLGIWRLNWVTAIKINYQSTNFKSMKINLTYPTLLLFGLMGTLYSCKKDASGTSAKTTLTTNAGITANVASGRIAVAAEDTSTTGKKDTLYMVNCFPPHHPADSVAFSALPSAITSYLSTNYPGYSFKKAFEILDSIKTVSNYIVVIKYNNNFVGLKFTAAGVFVSVLEQMLGQDMNNPQGCHPGGPFPGRGNPAKDTVALSALPAVVLNYFDKTYPADTLLHAFVTPDSTYVLISKDKGLYATNITASGTFISRMQVMPPMPSPAKPVAQSALPSTITTYLTTTYPGYVFNQAFADMNGSTVVGYDVFVTANNTNYAVHFNASGSYVSAITLH